MEYRKTSHNGVNIVFEGIEVDAVREAYTEYVLHLQSLGNDSSINKHHKWVVAWKGPKQAYTGASNEPLVQILQGFIENTDERVDEILDDDSTLNPYRYEQAGKRLEMGQTAAHLLMFIEFDTNIDREWKELFD